MPRLSLPRLASAALALALSLVACADPGLGPSANADRTAAERAPSAADRVTAAVRWNALTRVISGRRGEFPPQAARAFAIVSVAMYDAVIAAEDGKDRGVHPSEAGAAAAAGATVLAGLYPAERATVDAQLVADARYAASLPSERDADWASGVAIGRTVGLAALARAATDRSDAVWTGTVPTGPGLWILSPGARPQLPLWGSVRPWLMTSNDEFRPPPPPAFGSPEFLAALAEVRQISDTRTAEQLRIAAFWQTGINPAAAPGFLSAVASGLVQEHHLDERKAARVFAVMDMAVMDASIACWDAKFHYWLIRPYQADRAITTPVGFPQHPSYPSAHSCLLSSGAAVLAGLFPSQADELMAMVEEAGLARIYAGLHYRFDILAGREIGFSVAALALERAPNDHEPIPLDVR